MGLISIILIILIILIIVGALAYYFYFRSIVWEVPGSIYNGIASGTLVYLVSSGQSSDVMNLSYLGVDSNQNLVMIKNPQNPADPNVNAIWQYILNNNDCLNASPDTGSGFCPKTGSPKNNVDAPFCSFCGEQLNTNLTSVSLYNDNLQKYLGFDSYGKAILTSNNLDYASQRNSNATVTRFFPNRSQPVNEYSLFPTSLVFSQFYPLQNTEGQGPYISASGSSVILNTAEDDNSRWYNILVDPNPNDQIDPPDPSKTGKIILPFGIALFIGGITALFFGIKRIRDTPLKNNKYDTIGLFITLIGSVLFLFGLGLTTYALYAIFRLKPYSS